MMQPKLLLCNILRVLRRGLCIATRLGKVPLLPFLFVFNLLSWILVLHLGASWDVLKRCINRCNCREISQIDGINK